MDKDHIKDLLSNEVEWRKYIIKKVEGIESDLQALRGRVAIISAGIATAGWVLGQLVSKFMDKI